MDLPSCLLGGGETEAMLAHSQAMVTLWSAAQSVPGDNALTNVAHTAPSGTASPVAHSTFFLLSPVKNAGTHVCLRRQTAV